MTDFWKKITKPITVLAPMDDVTDVVFREIIARIAKPDVFFTEFTSAEALCSVGRNKVSRKLKYTENQRPIVAQIWGYDPECFKNAAAYIGELGFDGIDINMGCPDKNVMKKGSGAALINNKELAKKLIDSIRSETPNLSLSVKTRIDDIKDKTREWITFLLSQDISALTLHGRTAKELSKVPADWEEIGKAVKLRNEMGSNVLVIGNGDVGSYSEVIDKHKVYGVDGVMIGRGIFHNPWIFEKNVNAKIHGKDDFINLLKKHTKLFDDTWGKTKNFEIMKKFFKIYVKDFKGANQLRQELMQTRSYEEFQKVIEE